MLSFCRVWTRWSSAGSGAKTGPEKTTDVDQNAAIRLIEDCETHGVRRFVMVSAIGADPNSESNRFDIISEPRE